jgi:hypothetical protein
MGGIDSGLADTEELFGAGDTVSQLFTLSEGILHSGSAGVGKRGEVGFVGR